MSDAIFKPMLAGKFEAGTQRFPALASPKLDGIRCLAMGGKPKSRSMKDIPNRHIQRLFAEHAEILEGLDGEFILGDPTAADVYRVTNSAVMAHDGEPAVDFHVFDNWKAEGSYQERLLLLLARLRDGWPSWVKLVPHKALTLQEELDAYEAEMLGQGYEGVMLRCPKGPYKQGRSSTREGYLLKVKRNEDTEAIIVGFEERMHNANEAFKNELGRTKRSTAQAGLVGRDSLGAFICRGLPGTPFAGVEFNVGTGFDEAQRVEFWRRQKELMGQVITYKFFAVGVKDAPRHPVFKGFRDPIDFQAAA